MFVMVMAGYDDPAARAICDKLQTLANMMAAADEQRCRELISAIDYEMVWWRVYDQMTPGGTATSGVHGRGQGARSGRVSFQQEQRREPIVLHRHEEDLNLIRLPHGAFGGAWVA